MHKRGAKVAFGGFFLDAVTSSKRKKNSRFGVNWVVVGLAVHLPFRPDRSFCPPVPWRAYRKKGTPGHRTRTELAAELAHVIANWLPGRECWLVGDAAYLNATALRDRPKNLRMIGPLRWDAARYDRPPAPVGQRTGRPRKKGDRLPTPREMIEDTAGCPGEVQKVRFGSTDRRLRVPVIRDVLWYTGAKTEPVSLVLVRDVAGQWRDEALLATSRDVSAEFVIAGYCRRWCVEIDQLRAEVRNLTSQLADRRPTPANSSLPPSAQHPHAKPTPTRPRSRKERGGQPGHPEHARPLVPTDDCDRVVPLAPTACRRCHAVLTGTDPAPLRHQVWELPEIKPVVTEYQRHRLTCGCRATTCADLPPGVPLGQSGSRLVALTGLLMAHFRQSKRRTALFLESLLGQPCCAAPAVKMQHQVTAALRPAYDALVAQLPAQPHLGINESPTRQAASKAWLWTFVAKWFTAFAIHPIREATALGDLLTDRFGGVVMCDRARCTGRRVASSGAGRTSRGTSRR